MMAALLLAESALGSAVPNGTWLSQPQIWFHASTQTLDKAMAQIRAQQYQVVFLDYRNVPEAVQAAVRQAARKQGLIPVVWVQAPQYRSLSVPQIIHEARYADGIQVDDHFFAHYSLQDFYQLRALYSKPIFCSIQPFQAALVPPTGCNQLDVQCYSSRGWRECINLAQRLGAVVSLSAQETFGDVDQLNGQRFNVFLWPDSERIINP